jgi:hypothetical protein
MSTRSPRALVAGLAVWTAVLLVAGVLGVVLVRPSSEITGVDGTMKAQITAVARWVEKARGLRFRTDVHVNVLSSDEFKARLQRVDTSPDAPTKDELRKAAQANADLLFALGIADHHYDANAAGDAYADVVDGSYDQVEKVLNLPDLPLTPARRVVIAHELTHALDDQSFGLSRQRPRLVDETGIAFRALAEGDAEDIERQYLESLSPDDRAAATKESEAAGDAANLTAIPDGVIAALSFPYAAGIRFVQALRSAGGNAGVDAAFRRPPATTEQVLHPDRFLSGQAIAYPTRPKPNGAVVDRDVLGEMGLRIILATYGGATAVGAADGWGGDRYVGWTDQGKVCVKAVIRMDTSRDVDELLAQLGPWNKAHPGSSVTRQTAGGKDELTLENCVPQT